METGHAARCVDQKAAVSFRRTGLPTVVVTAAMPAGGNHNAARHERRDQQAGTDECNPDEVTHERISFALLLSDMSGCGITLSLSSIGLRPISQDSSPKVQQRCLPGGKLTTTCRGRLPLNRQKIGAAMFPN
jgi:hypothetical protein